MSTVDVEPLVISQSPKRLLSMTVIFALVVTAYLLGGVSGVLEPWLVWAGGVFFGLMIVLGLVSALRARTARWELRLAADGVTVRERQPIPWSDLAEVRVRSLFPRWIPLVMRSYYVVAFVGQPGVVMPSLPSARIGFLSGHGERARDRRFGTRLVVPPKTFDASTDAMLDAVQRFSSVPVIREWRFRPAPVARSRPDASRSTGFRAFEWLAPLIGGVSRADTRFSSPKTPHSSPRSRTRSGR